MAKKPFDKSVYDHPDLPGAGAKKRKNLDKFGKVRATLGEFKRGALRSGSGEHVTNPKQAIAIGLNEAGLSKKGKK